MSGFSRTAVAGSVALLAFWVVQGTIGFKSPSGGTLGVLPVGAGAFMLAGAAAALTALLARRARTLVPTLILGLALLPWLPIRPPAAFFVWSGPVGWAICLAVLIVLIACAGFDFGRIVLVANHRPALTAGLLAAVIYGCAAWYVAPSRPGGDEPHYLVITQSILYDRDLRIENNHRRGDYREYFAGDLSRPDYLRRGRDGEIYSIHAPGAAVLVLPAFALAGYRGVVLFLILISSATAALTWQLGYRVTGRRDAAWFAWAALVVSPTMMLNAFTVYPDGPAGFIVLSGMWALVRARDERESGATSTLPWLLHGAALAMLPWLHTRFAVLAAGIGGFVLLHLGRTRNPAAKAIAFLAVPTVSALAWIAYFVAIYGVADPGIPYRGSDLGSPSYIAGGLAGILFDQQYGLLVYAPVMAVALAGFVPLARHGGRYRWVAAELLFVMVPYGLTVTHFAMWWGGWSAPARFLVPLLPVFAVTAAPAWSAGARRGTRMAMIAALAATAFMAALLVTRDGGQFAYHGRDEYAASLEWLGPAADLQHGLPSFFARVRRGQPGLLFYEEIAVWFAVLVGGWLVARVLDKSPRLHTRARLATATVLVFAAATMVALSIVWRMEGVNGRSAARAQLDLLRRTVSGTRLIALDTSSWRRIPLADLSSWMHIRIDARKAAVAGARDNQPLITLPVLPAGEYRFHVNRRGSAGWLMLGIGNDQFALQTAPAESFGAEPIHFPVDVRAIIRGDEDARQRVDGVVLEPTVLMQAVDRPAQGIAAHAVRYGSVTVFFMDEGSFPEPNGFWVGGARRSFVVVQSDEPRAEVSIALRNGPVANAVKIEAGVWREDAPLEPGEQRQVRVPLDPSRTATLVSFETLSGFRPAAIDAASRDQRFLGVWIRVEQ